MAWGGKGQTKRQEIDSCPKNLPLKCLILCSTWPNNTHITGRYGYACPGHIHRGQWNLLRFLNCVIFALMALLFESEYHNYGQGQCLCWALSHRWWYLCHCSLKPLEMLIRTDLKIDRIAGSILSIIRFWFDHELKMVWNTFKLVGLPDQLCNNSKLKKKPILTRPRSYRLQPLPILEYKQTSYLLGRFNPNTT